jgi:predicted ester cyclase
MSKFDGHRTFYIALTLNRLWRNNNPLTPKRKKNLILANRYHSDRISEVADEILSPDFVLHNPLLPEEVCIGPEGTKKYASAVIAAVPDRKIVHDDTFTKGEKILVRWTNTGTNTGALFGNPPTSKPIVVTGFDLFRISDGKIKELWQLYNFGSWE